MIVRKVALDKTYGEAFSYAAASTLTFDEFQQ